MAAYKLLLDEDDLIDFSLIAIYTTIEDYRLAFMLNQLFSVSFSRYFPNGNNKSSMQEMHRVFLHKDQQTGMQWEILRNKIEIQSLQKNLESFLEPLFAQVATSSYIVPEKKNVDYFLKIRDHETLLDKITQMISSIPNITAAFEVRVPSLKSKNNLIY